MSEVVVFGISTGFPELSRCDGQIAHVLLTRSPLVYPRRGLTARLACVKHAASVRPEPGSNSPLKSSDVVVSDAESSNLGVSRQELPPGMRGGFLPKEPSSGRRIDQGRSDSLRRGVNQINSSTFGTLLSSQGSSAHQRRAFRPSTGATCLTLPGPHNPVKSAVLGPGPGTHDLCRAGIRSARERTDPPRSRCG